MNSDSRIERMQHLKNRINRAKRTASLLLALVCVITVSGQTLVPAARTSTAAEPPGDLIAPRSGHTATLLTTGKVVIVGGEGLSGAGVSGEELFDPGTGTWSAIGNLQAARIGHTATLLTDGQLLVAGGWGFADLPLDSAELYDPATGKWSATGKLTTSRTGHTATLLPDGKVLVAGGSGDALLGSAELYDPTSGTWHRTGELNTFRAGHTATLLQNGKVLVTAGDNGFEFDTAIFNSAELYDAETGTWSETGSLHRPRFLHSATLLPNGNVLVAGGVDILLGTILLDSAELYDPDAGTWSITGNLNVPRWGPATLLPNGKVLTVGGSTAELYDPETGTWSLTARLNAPRRFHTATLLPDGRVLATGGRSSIGSTGPLNSSEFYDPNTETWIGPPVPVITGTSVVGKKLLVFGEDFERGAVILRSGIELPTKDSGENPTTLVGRKKAGKKTKPGDRLQVLNRSSGALSKEFVFSGS